MNHGRCFKSDCDNQELARGRCSKHYVEWSKAKERDLTGVDPSRFWAKVDQSGDCWEWTAYRSTGGYGSMGVGGIMVGAHRVAWTLENGPIPRGALVLHRCDNPPCVNPDHLFLGTHQDNSDDKIAKGRQVRGGR